MGHRPYPQRAKAQVSNLKALPLNNMKAIPLRIPLTGTDSEYGYGTKEKRKKLEHKLAVPCFVHSPRSIVQRLPNMLQ